MSHVWWLGAMLGGKYNMTSLSDNRYFFLAYSLHFGPLILA